MSVQGKASAFSLTLIQLYTNSKEMTLLILKHHKLQKSTLHISNTAVMSRPILSNVSSDEIYILLHLCFFDINTLIRRAVGSSI